MTNVISVKFRDNFGEYSKEYTYLCDYEIKELDFVLVPGNPELDEWYMVARVKRILDERSLKKGVNYKRVICVLNTKPAPTPQTQSAKAVLPPTKLTVPLAPKSPQPKPASSEFDDAPF